MSPVVVQMRGADEARELLKDLSGRDLENRVRRGTRRGAGVFRVKIRSEGRSRSGIPDSFAKTKTRYHRNPVGTSVGPTSPLLNIFEEGANDHTIAPGYSGTSVGGTTRGGNARGARAGTFTGRLLMSGEAGDRWRSRDFVAGAPVHHPGMAPRPFIGPIWDSENEKASESAMDEIMRGIR